LAKFLIFQRVQCVCLKLHKAHCSVWLRRKRVVSSIKKEGVHEGNTKTDYIEIDIGDYSKNNPPQNR